MVGEDALAEGDDDGVIGLDEDAGLDGAGVVFQDGGEVFDDACGVFFTEQAGGEQILRHGVLLLFSSTPAGA